jgi:hypothetical protein
MNEKIRRSKYKGELDLAGYKVPCFVLEDGTRTISNMRMQVALKMVNEKDEQKSGTRLDRHLSQKSLKPFIYKGKKHDHYDPIVFYYGNQKISGQEATRLVDFGDGMLEARNHIKLLPRQKIIAEQSEIIIRSFAKVGIIALVDEATGYQYEREKFALQKVFKLLILEDGIFSEARRFFPLGYYKDMFGVYNIDFTAENISRKPPFIGYLTSELVYKNLPAGSFVLKKIKERTPKTKGGHYKKRFYRSLTPLGEKALAENISIVRTLAWVSKGNRKMFLKLVKERFHPERDLPYIDIEAMENDKKENRVDKVLGALLKTPKPKKK